MIRWSARSPCCAAAASCGGLEGIDGVCEKRCDYGADCPSLPGGPIAECSVSMANDAGMTFFYCAGGCRQ
jgi:hypothetical protein